MEIYARIAETEWKLLSRKEFCAWVGIRSGTLAKWVRNRQVPTLKIGASSLVMIGPGQTRSDFVMLLKRFRSKPRNSLHQEVS